MMHLRTIGVAGAVVSAAIGLCVLLPAGAGAEPSGSMTKAAEANAQKLLQGGVKFLLSQREPDGGWSLGKGAFKPAAGANLGLCVVLNEDDGKGRFGFLGWFSDVQSKQVDAVGDLILGE